MANSIRQSELDRLKNSIRDMTDLSRSVRNTFDEINSVTGDTADKFKTIVDNAKQNANLVERYLISQQLTKKIQSQINEFKSKSGYLDRSQLEFRKSELLLQKKIATAQISRLLNSQLDNDAKEQAINAIKTRMMMESAELDILEKQVDTQNDIVRALEDQLTAAQKLGEVTIEQDNLFDQGKNKLLDWYNKFKSINVLQKGIALATTAFVAIIKKGYENFLAFDTAATSVRQTLGFFPGEMDALRGTIKNVTFDLMDMGATFDDVAKSVTAIASEINGIVAQDKELLTTVTALAKNFGISEATSAKFLKTMGGVSNQTAKSQTSMIGFSKNLAKASGVPLDQLMKDVADAGDNARIYAGRTAVELVKAAAGARMLGTNLESAAKSADQLLNFESSINSELKASALLGRNIDFNRARQLAFSKDILGSEKEILRITKGIKFNELNPIQQKAYAEAAGKTVGELQDMLQAEKNMQLLRESGTQEQRDLINEYDRLMQMKEEQAQSEGEIAEQQIKQRLNQERMAQLQNKFNKLISELAGPVMDFVEPLLDLAIKIFPGLIAGMKIFSNGVLFVTGLSLWKMIPKAIGVFSRFFSGGAGFLKSFGAAIVSISKSFGIFVKGLSFIGKLLGPIGLVISAFSLIGNLMKRWQEAPDGILGGFEAIAGALYDTFLKPFVDAYDWIAGMFVGKSPSKLALGILKGIQSVAGLILDALTLPFRLFWNNTVAKIPGVPALGAPSEALGLGGAGGESGEGSIGGNDKLMEVISTGNQQIVNKIDELITALGNGGIGVNLDGVKVNYALAKSAVTRGSFGQATF